MFTQRWGQTATELTNGTLLIAGGQVYNQYNPVQIVEATNEAEIFDPNTGNSTMTGFMNDTRAFNQADLMARRRWAKSLFLGARSMARRPAAARQVMASSIPSAQTARDFRPCTLSPAAMTVRRPKEV
jgi:hypothetical protein